MIYLEKKKDGTSAALPVLIENALPQSVRNEIATLENDFLATLEEIRLRRGRLPEYIALGTGVFGSKPINDAEMDDTVYALCERSVYAHTETICRGYIRAPCGVRIGVCGRAVTENGKVTAVRDISSLNIRLPRGDFPDVSALAEILSENGGGMLVFSPPRVGKTTVLRALARELSGKRQKHVAIVDTRGELSYALDGERLRVDILDGYPRGDGIENAIRTLSPDMIICDEIGSDAEAEAILSAQNCGVPVIASLHAGSLREAAKKQKNGIKELYAAEVFSTFVLLERGTGKRRCTWKIYGREEFLQA